MKAEIHGTVAPGFGPVAEAFAANFAERSEVGAAFAAFVEGRPVADLWAGEARPGVPWEEGTMAVVFSTSKGPTALTVQALADAGALDIEAPIAAYWPAFTAGGGIGTARALATMYDALANGGSGQGRRIVSERSIAAHAAEARNGPDLVLLFDTRYGLGYQLPTPFADLGPSPTAFGHAGLGGSAGFADPERRVAAAYVPNQILFPAPGRVTRAGALTTALYACLAP